MSRGFLRSGLVAWVSLSSGCHLVGGIEEAELRAKSCQEIHQHDPTLGSGAYLIAPEGPAEPPAEVYCDMVSDGGGWTLVARFALEGELNVPDPEQNWMLDTGPSRDTPRRVDGPLYR